MMIQQTRRVAVLVAFFLAPIAQLAFIPNTLADGPRQVREFRGETMGTTYMVKVAGADSVDDQSLRIGIDLELRRVNDQMSTYLKSSEISRFNQSEETDWFGVSPEFASVVAAAQEISEKTDGAFDITVGPLVNAWSFGTGERTRTIPEESEIERLRQFVGYQKLQVRLEPPALKKNDSSLQIDLSSIAKGHGVDRVIDRLAELGANDVFVEVGGEVRTAGDKPGGAWKVGIQLPDAARDQVMIAHPMLINAEAGNAMATSGDYRIHFEVDGKRYSHTLDPRTGWPIKHDLASVTVIATNCMLADGWATALNVLGQGQGLRVAQENGVETLLIARQDDGKFTLAGTGALSEYAKPGFGEEEATNGFGAILPVAALSFAVFSILLLAMAIGVLFGRKSISGSCGGLNNQSGEGGSCALCSNPSDACKELRDKMAESKLNPDQATAEQASSE